MNYELEETDDGEPVSMQHEMSAEPTTAKKKKKITAMTEYQKGSWDHH